MTTIGKRRGLARLTDGQGFFSMIALDQRPPMAQAIAAARGIDMPEVTFAEMIAAKRMLVKGLSRAASAMLFDPNYAIPAAIDLMPPDTSLIVTLEDHRFQETTGGQLSRSIDNWSVDKIRRIGGDAVKLLVWYRPDAEAAVLRHQRDYVRTVGADCRRNDIPFVLELLTYTFAGASGHTAEYRQAADKRAAHVIESVREFAKPEYGVDLFKLETPVPGADLPPPDGSPAALAAAEPFAEIGKLCGAAGIPWVLLSGGVAQAEFERVLRYACAAGAQGFLAGRTIWLDAIRDHFPDEARVVAALGASVPQRLDPLRAIVAETARPWRFGEPVRASREGEFAMAYV
jgi:tagatose 1,6-diphosphate aldolase